MATMMAGLPEPPHSFFPEEAGWGCQYQLGRLTWFENIEMTTKFQTGLRVQSLRD